MCGRYGFQDPDKLREYYDLESEVGDIKPRYNIAPSQQVPVILKNSHNKLYKMRWGLIPFWAKDMAIGYRMINARAEGIDSKPAYRKPFKSQHCLIPASFFYEWDKVTGSRIPYLIKVKNTKIFSFAGLYDIWLDASGKKFYSFTIITTEPNRVVAKIHDRMPVVLEKKEESIWLDLNNPQTTKLLDSYPADKMEMYPVSRLLNKPANDRVDVTKKVKLDKS